MRPTPQPPPTHLLQRVKHDHTRNVKEYSDGGRTPVHGHGGVHEAVDELGAEVEVRLDVLNHDGKAKGLVWGQG